MLEIVAEALHFNEVRHCMCVNRSKDFGPRGALAHFKTEADLRVLLMPLHLGAEGLDLIVASRVFLLEPLVNKALETQAINRIHRIGQTRQAVVHKYVILGTVEQNIHERGFTDDQSLDENDECGEPTGERLSSSNLPFTPPRAGATRVESTRTPASDRSRHSLHSPDPSRRRAGQKGDAKVVSFVDIQSLLGGH